jgi:hypothetical protein
MMSLHKINQKIKYNTHKPDRNELIMVATWLYLMLLDSVVIRAGFEMDVH